MSNKGTLALIGGSIFAFISLVVIVRTTGGLDSTNDDVTTQDKGSLNGKHSSHTNQPGGKISIKMTLKLPVTTIQAQPGVPGATSRFQDIYSEGSTNGGLPPTANATIVRDSTNATSTTIKTTTKMSHSESGQLNTDESFITNETVVATTQEDRSTKRIISQAATTSMAGSASTRLSTKAKTTNTTESTKTNSTTTNTTEATTTKLTTKVTYPTTSTSTLETEPLPDPNDFTTTTVKRITSRIPTNINTTSETATADAMGRAERTIEPNNITTTTITATATLPTTTTETSRIQSTTTQTAKTESTRIPSTTTNTKTTEIPSTSVEFPTITTITETTGIPSTTKTTILSTTTNPPTARIREATTNPTTTTTEPTTETTTNPTTETTTPSPPPPTTKEATTKSTTATTIRTVKPAAKPTAAPVVISRPPAAPVVTTPKRVVRISCQTFCFYKFKGYNSSQICGSYKNKPKAMIFCLICLSRGCSPSPKQEIV